MQKKIFVIALFFIASLSILLGEKLGNVSIEEGKPLPFDKGVTWEYGDSEFIRLFIHDGIFVLVFLDSQKKVRIPKNIDLAVVHTRLVSGQRGFSPYHLYPSEGGLLFSNSRQVYEPHYYNVEVFLKKEMGHHPPHRARRFDTRYVRESFDARLLDQRPVKRKRF